MQLKLFYKGITMSSAFCWCYIHQSVPLDPKLAALNFCKKNSTGRGGYDELSSCYLDWSLLSYVVSPDQKLAIGQAIVT